MTREERLNDEGWFVEEAFGSVKHCRGLPGCTWAHYIRNCPQCAAWLAEEVVESDA